jgi:hypothetical protein
VEDDTQVRRPRATPAFRQDPLDAFHLGTDFPKGAPFTEFLGDVGMVG